MAETILVDPRHRRCGQRQRNPLVMIGFGHVARSQIDERGCYLLSEWFMLVGFPIVPLRRLYVRDLGDTLRMTTDGGMLSDSWMDVLGVTSIGLLDAVHAIAYRWLLMPLAFVLAALPFIWVLERDPYDANAVVLIGAIIGIALVPIMAAILVIGLSDRHRNRRYDVMPRTSS